MINLVKSITFCTVAILLLNSSCSSDKKNVASSDKYPVTRPVNMDTTYTTEYIAGIQSQQNVELRARLRGYLEAIFVDEGKPVKAGQVLFRISSQEYREALLQAKAALKSAIAEGKVAEVELLNAKILVDKKIVSQTELSMAQAKLEAANARVDEARAFEANAKLKLSFAEIRAPFDGVIDRIPNKVGSLIDEGTLLTTLSDNKEVFAYFDFSEKEYLEYLADKKNEKKTEVSLMLANNKVYKYKGTIETIEGEFDQNTGSISLRARFSNPDLVLKNGASGKIRIQKTVKDALIIPQKATFEVQDKMYVYVLDKNHQVRMRSVVPKYRIPHLYILESGVCSTDVVIYEGIQNVREGMKVIPAMIPLKAIIGNLSRQ